MSDPRRALLGIPGLSRSPAIVIGLWFASVAIAAGIYLATGSHVNTCFFRFASGKPCVACGGTRAALRLARGDLDGAFRFNPAATVALLALPLGVIAWLMGVRWNSLPRWARRAIACAAGAALLANWAYVLTHLPALEAPSR